jgi:hypothetical protein
MKKKIYFTIVLVMVLGVAHIMFGATAESETSREYQIKAAFLFNFFKFVDWPEEKTADSNEPFTIGVIGTEPFGKSLEPIKEKEVKGRKVVIKQIKNLKEKESSKNNKDAIEALRKCHLLFICSSEKENMVTIIEALKDSSVLTVGETAGFLESGGIINFLMEDKKVCFEINNFAAKQASLKIRSKLLRLARRVIEEKPSGDSKK